MNWLFTNVAGFADRREARKYASQMLKVIDVKYQTDRLQLLNNVSRLASSDTRSTSHPSLNNVTTHLVILLPPFSLVISR